MDSIVQTDEIMANFLGIASKKRVKRFWQAALTVVAPYVLPQLAEGLSKTLFGNNVDKQQLQRYDQEISQLRGTQQEIINQVDAQRTMFEIDSERKSNQIKYLKRTQDGIKRELNILQSTFSQDSGEKEKKIKDLNDMLSETQRKLKSQEEKQQRLMSDVDMIEDGVKRINDDLDDIRREITVNKINIEANKIETRLNTISVNFNFLLSRFVSEQKTLLDVIKNANRGFLDPYIITPLNLIEMLQEVQHMLPEDSRLPFHPTFKYAKNLYKIIKPTVSFYNNTILFILRIPLVHTRTFEIFKMTSLPMAVGNNKFVFVLPKKEYLLINDRLDHLLEYVLTSATDLREFCEDLGNNEYICDQIQQINGASSNSECEVQLYLNKKELSKSCNIRVMKLDKPIFLQLQRYGSWIYMAPESENVIISCGNSRKNVPVKGVGYLQVFKDCSARTSGFSLRAIVGSKSIPVEKVYIPGTDLKDYVDMSLIDQYDEIAPSDHKQVILPNELNELDSISVKLKNINPSNNYTMIILIVVGSITLILLILIFRKKICFCCYSSSKEGGERQTDARCLYTKDANPWAIHDS